MDVLPPARQLADMTARGIAEPGGAFPSPLDIFVDMGGLVGAVGPEHVGGLGEGEVGAQVAVIASRRYPECLHWPVSAEPAEMRRFR
jgi:hypothetical protein